MYNFWVNKWSALVEANEKRNMMIHTYLSWRALEWILNHLIENHN